MLWLEGCIPLFAPYNSHYHHYADLTEFVSKSMSFLSIMFHAVSRAVCFQLTHFSWDDFENMCTLSYLIITIKPRVWIIWHFFRVRSLNSGMHMSCYVLVEMFQLRHFNSDQNSGGEYFNPNSLQSFTNMVQYQGYYINHCTEYICDV